MSKNQTARARSCFFASYKSGGFSLTGGLSTHTHPSLDREGRESPASQVKSEPALDGKQVNLTQVTELLLPGRTGGGGGDGQKGQLWTPIGHQDKWGCFEQ